MTKHDEHYDTPESKLLLKELKDKLHELETKEKRYMDAFKYRHKITFAFIVFFAINLVWYGMWTIVSDLPLLKDPVISLILGAIILIGTGYFYENMVSASLDKKRRKKKKELATSNKVTAALLSGGKLKNEETK